MTEARGPALADAYQGVVLVYLVALLFLYPYGVALGEAASVRVSDLFALAATAMGAAALILRQRIKVDHAILAIVGPFLLLELVAPFAGALGYRRPVDVVSSLRMALLWMPIVFLTMLAAPWRSLLFERRLAQVLATTLWVNFAYALLQVASAVGAFPPALLPTSWLEPWAVDKNFDLIQGLRPAGFFANSTALSVFGIVCLCFFYARFICDATRRDLVRTLLAFGVVLLSTSRTAYAAAAAILFAGWLHLSPGWKGVMAAIVVSGIAAVLLVVEQTIGVEQAFYRFQRLAESGLLEDVSFGSRYYGSWPAALEAARSYPLGTLIQAPRALPLIDSGYLNYYLQGRWLFVAALAVLLGGLWLVGLRAFFGAGSRRLGLMTLFLAIYLSGALVFSNPLRSPLMIAFIVFVLWRSGLEGRSLPMDARAVRAGA